MEHQRGISAVFRIYTAPEFPLSKSWGMPPTIQRILDEHQGLILVTWHIRDTANPPPWRPWSIISIRTGPHHILTIEDPIEFIHPFKKGVVNQRQLGRSTHSYANALKGALRQDPDVIVIGELRDLETISLAITAAETGHLVIGTLSTSSAPQDRRPDYRFLSRQGTEPGSSHVERGAQGGHYAAAYSGSGRHPHGVGPGDSYRYPGQWAI